MPDLISRAAAIEAALDGADDWDGGYNLSREEYIRSHMEKVPAVDAAPVVHGYWLEETDRYSHWHCSNCGKVQGITCIAMKYCPECGATMYEHPWAASGCGQAFSPD